MYSNVIEILSFEIWQPSVVHEKKTQEVKPKEHTEVNDHH